MCSSSPPFSKMTCQCGCFHIWARSLKAEREIVGAHILMQSWEGKAELRFGTLFFLPVSFHPSSEGWLQNLCICLSIWMCLCYSEYYCPWRWLERAVAVPPFSWFQEQHNIQERNRNKIYPLPLLDQKWINYGTTYLECRYCRNETKVAMYQVNYCIRTIVFWYSEI